LNTQFHPLVWQWFHDRFGNPTAAQEAGWRHISQADDTLIAAPTGSGKTLAAFLWSIDRLVRRGVTGRLDNKISVVYISPLKALANDIQINLQQPLSEIMGLAQKKGILLPEIRAAVRSGDTPTRERQLMTRHPPHILITTPESLYILLTAKRSRQILMRPPRGVWRTSCIPPDSSKNRSATMQSLVGTQPSTACVSRI